MEFQVWQRPTVLLSTKRIKRKKKPNRWNNNQRLSERTKKRFKLVVIWSRFKWKVSIIETNGNRELYDLFWIKPKNQFRFACIFRSFDGLSAFVRLLWMHRLTAASETNENASTVTNKRNHLQFNSTIDKYSENGFAFRSNDIRMVRFFDWFEAGFCINFIEHFYEKKENW